jgi:4-amino-4-deoxy-L-arabinose transferase-like glycosyltransferase
VTTLTAELRACVARPSSAVVAHGAGLAGVAGLSAFLNLWGLSRNGYANEYYSAAVRSMLESWHNFFFVAFDPGGLVSVDKPPLALWVQAASAKLFGYGSLSILVPEALAGVAGVLLLYALVARVWGRVAGLLAALTLAVTPVSVAVARDNNPDALLALLLVAAAYCGVRALSERASASSDGPGQRFQTDAGERGRPDAGTASGALGGQLAWVLACAAAVGLAVNTKMLAALVVVPGLGLAYLAAAPVAWRRRLVHLAAATALLVAVSGAWIAAVDLTPAQSRPYVGSTSDDSALSLLLDYNGLGRVTGQEGGTSMSPGGGGGGGGLGGAFSGTPGALRLFNGQLGDQGSWLLPFALAGGLSLLLAAARARRRLELGALLLLGGWFVAAAVVLSYASGIIHTYYVSMLAPAAAALVGAGAVALARDARSRGPRILLPLGALVATAAVELHLLERTEYLRSLRGLVAVGAAACAGTVLFAAAAAWRSRDETLARVAGAAVVVGLGVLLVSPAAWARSTHEAAVNGVFPGAGPSFVSGLTAGGGGFGFGGPRGGFAGPPGGGFRGPRGGGFGGGLPGPPRGGFGGGDSGSIDEALAYARSHGAAERFPLIVTSEQEAAPSIIAGQEIAAMAGFTGRETVLTPDHLARLVERGDARYFLLGGGGFRGRNDAVALIESACTEVTGWSTTSAGSSRGLYDCAGAADRIRTG